jgi:hypothetical protein
MFLGLQKTYVQIAKRAFVDQDEEGGSIWHRNVDRITWLHTAEDQNLVDVCFTYIFLTTYIVSDTLNLQFASTTTNLNYTEIFSSHREVNTLRLGYKTQSINDP